MLAFRSRTIVDKVTLNSSLALSGVVKHSAVKKQDNTVIKCYQRFSKLSNHHEVATLFNE